MRRTWSPCCRGDAVDAKHLGLAVSAIPAHQRLTADRARESARHEAAQTVEHVGVVRDKVTLTGVVRTALQVEATPTLTSQRAARRRLRERRREADHRRLGLPAQGRQPSTVTGTIEPTPNGTGSSKPSCPAPRTTTRYQRRSP